MNLSSEELAVPVKAKRTEGSRRRGVIMDAIREAKQGAVAKGQHDRAKLIGIAGQSLDDETLNAIYKAVASDAA